MILNDRQIIYRIENHAMITPAHLQQVKLRGDTKIISMGVSSFGYDIQLGSDFKIFTDVHCGHIDPKNFDTLSFVEKHVEWPAPMVIPPNGFVLGHSAEWWKIPRDVAVVILGKSTYARCGLSVNCTPLEPEWEGHITLELTNSTPLPLVVYPGEGIAQAMFHQNPDGCANSYNDRGGKYQGQVGLTLPRV